jgi:hypothetical protein
MKWKDLDIALVEECGKFLAVPRLRIPAVLHTSGSLCEDSSLCRSASPAIAAYV